MLTWFPFSPSSPYYAFDKRFWSNPKRPRTKQTNPYNYDSFTVWAKRGNTEFEGCIYTDRFNMWDYEKLNRLSRELWGDESHLSWGNRKPKDVEKFLQLWHDDKTIELVRIVECCNQSTGSPLWALYWRHRGKKKSNPDTGDGQGREGREEETSKAEGTEADAHSETGESSSQRDRPSTRRTHRG